ncbi:phage integrase SAM-like domain-containing protein [Flavobacterium sp.]|uniref:phage integrase SAM-like domain-containing protein n=1 Tax=Flavobacterium sp. TaxID=239 RepID=UPI002C584C15|nr:phage integrase SAM-like domain-containing protein [Flavobacterium sp.]HSD06519.1 phage integrase SAM-like domain-containing protein [Flavobacterium sp.]
MATINFLYRSTKDKANLHLRLLFRLNETDFVFGVNTKFEVSKDYWNGNHVIDKKTKKIRGTKEPELLNKRLEVNTELNKIENHILKAFNSVKPDEVNKEWLQTQIDNYYDPPQEAEALPKELIKYVDYYIEIKRNEVSNGTIKKCNVIKQLLIRHQEHEKKTFLIADIDTQYKIGFEKYCINNQYAPNTIARAVKFVKTICKHARLNGLEISYQLDNIKTKFQKVDSVYLTFDELEKIEKIKKIKLTDSLDNAKDWLIISCYCGQRVSDFMRFDKSMIRYEKDDKGELKPLIEFTQVKTNKIMTVPLHPKVIEILNKRGGEFPYAISDQKYNDYIKTVCEIAKITYLVNGSKKTETEPESGIFRKETKEFRKCDLVTSHIGRRSFATNFYGSNIPTALLINITGHSTEAMFLTYIGKSNKDLAKETFKYFKV